MLLAYGSASGRFGHFACADAAVGVVAAQTLSAWVRLIARIYEVDPLNCRRCGGNMQLIAFITERAVIVRILDHIGELKPRATHGTDPRPSWH